jgi:CubicO group peptidase (beta-lactamase class C family)
MTLETLENVGSISKTVVTTALMQLWEKGRFKLDDDVAKYLTFPVRNPTHPRDAITVRYLLTHTSSIADGSAYTEMYACGDPTMTLGDWLRQYLVPGGALFRPAENYRSWTPGTKWDYSNVAHGLAAHLVESLSQTPFSEYCRRSIFEPLEMKETSWYLGGIDASKHAVPYSWVSGGKVRGPSRGGTPQGVVGAARATPRAKGDDGYEPNCLYNHPSYPTGFLRTSVAQLARYVRAYLYLGARDKVRVLRDDTVREMLTSQRLEGGRVQGLTWYGLGSGERVAWGETGADPGINTDFRFRLYDGAAAIVFTNTYGIKPEEITARLLREAESL